MIRMPCSKCGTTEYPKYRRMKLRASGKRTPMMASYCILCHREQQNIIDSRRYLKKIEYNRKWRSENKEKVNKYKRKEYLKKVGRLTKSKKEYKLPKSEYKFSDFNFRNKNNNIFLTEKF